MSLYNRLLDMHENTNLISKRSLGDLEIFCYTKEAFFGFQWNEETLKARGLIFKNGVQINKPFDKIFNLGEVPENSEHIITERLENEPHYLMDKCNGHLFIISAYKDNDGVVDFVYSTKGSLPHENNPLLLDDLKVFEQYRRDVECKMIQYINKTRSRYLTLMCEAMVEHDKHTMYDQQVEMYGENTFVILGGNTDNGELSYDDLMKFKGPLPVTLFYDEEEEAYDFEEMKSESEIEGYVIWFPSDGTRVKIKTREYWKARFKKDLTTERILQVYRAGGVDRLRLRLPEEVSEQIIPIVLKAHALFFETKYVYPLPKSAFELTGKELFTATHLSAEQKSFLANRDKFMDNLQYSVRQREDFHEDYENVAFVQRMLEEELGAIVDSI